MPDGQALAAPTLRTLQIGLKWFAGGALGAGGADRFYSDLMRHLPAERIEIEGIVVGPDDADALSDGRVHGIGCADAPLRARMRAGRRAVSRAVARGRFDLVASHFGMLTAASLGTFGGLPLVVHFHGPWADESAAEGQGRLAVAVKRTLERLVCRRGAVVVTMSHAFADLAHANYGVPREKIRIVPGAVDVARFDIKASRAEARDLLGLPQDRPIFISVRRLANRMGLENLIAAMRAVADAHPEALLCIGGKGQLAPVLAAQVASLGLADHVKLLGFIPDDALPLAYRASDLNLVPTLALEGFGLTAVEALGAGTPSMVTPIGGLPEIVRPLAPALVLRSSAPDDIASGLLDFLEGRIDVPDAAACRSHAARYAPDRIAAEIAAIYREVVRP